MSTNALESEDLDNVQLVRMEDVQPSREARVEVFDSCIIVDNVEYDNECVVDDGDSNIESSELPDDEDGADEESDSTELIVPEVLEPLDEMPIDIEETTQAKANPDRWPTLEILPGGVIKHADKCEDLTSHGHDAADGGEMMYACAKCSQSFKYLFCLVKHVKWHEDEQKRQKVLDMTKLNTLEKDLVNVKRERYEFEKSYKRQKVEVLGRIAAAIGKLRISTDKDEYICLHSGKQRLVISKPNKKKAPKRLKS